eukprot:SAG22_NODE_573_length_8999_cov_9.592921_1_plen_200_part_10
MEDERVHYEDRRIFGSSFFTGAPLARQHTLPAYETARPTCADVRVGSGGSAPGSSLRKQTQPKPVAAAAAATQSIRSKYRTVGSDGATSSVAQPATTVAEEHALSAQRRPWEPGMWAAERGVAQLEVQHRAVKKNEFYDRLASSSRAHAAHTHHAGSAVGPLSPADRAAARAHSRARIKAAKEAMRAANPPPPPPPRQRR